MRIQRVFWQACLTESSTADTDRRSWKIWQNMQKVPVWNGLTNEFHPTQMLADLMTIRHHFGKIRGIRLSFFGDCRYNMANSWMVAGAKCGMHITLCANPAYFPDEDLVRQCREIAAQTGGTSRSGTGCRSRSRGCRCPLHRWSGYPWANPWEAWAERIEQMKPYQVTEKLMKLAAEGNAIFMHCLPAFHDLGTSIGREIHERVWHE